MSTRSIGLMGGTFDPIHHAHLIVAEEVRYALNLSEMVFIPAGEPPHKLGRITAPVQDRLAMVELAVASNPHFSVSRVEVDRPGPPTWWIRYTYSKNNGEKMPSFSS